MQDVISILDGGLASEIENQGIDISGHLWSAEPLAQEPAIVRRAHAKFVRQGANILISASYYASRIGLSALGYDLGESDEIIGRSVDVARSSSRAASTVLVAASLGPYGACLADGSEYSGSYAAKTLPPVPFDTVTCGAVLAHVHKHDRSKHAASDQRESVDKVDLSMRSGLEDLVKAALPKPRAPAVGAGRESETVRAAAAGSSSSSSTSPVDDDASVLWLRDFHAPRIAALISRHPDLIAAETIPCIAEGIAICSLLKEANERALANASRSDELIPVEDVAACCKKESRKSGDYSGAAAAARSRAAAPVPGWISFQIKSSTQLASGESVEDAVRQVIETAGAHRRSVMAKNACPVSAGAVAATKPPEIRSDTETETSGCFPLVGVGVNCCHPEHAVEAAHTIARVLDEFEWSYSAFPGPRPGTSGCGPGAGSPADAASSTIDQLGDPSAARGGPHSGSYHPASTRKDAYTPIREDASHHYMKGALDRWHARVRADLLALPVFSKNSLGTRQATQGSGQPVAAHIKESSPKESVREAAATRPERPAIVLYPNRGEAWDATKAEWVAVSPPESEGVSRPGFPAAATPGTSYFVSRMIVTAYRLHEAHSQAFVLGGCCRVSPALIGELAAAVRGRSSSGKQGTVSKLVDPEELPAE